MFLLRFFRVLGFDIMMALFRYIRGNESIKTE